MIEELEQEITETRFMAQRAGGGDLQKLEAENKKLQTELSTLRNNYDEMSKEIGKTFFKLHRHLFSYAFFFSFNF